MARPGMRLVALDDPPSNGPCLPLSLVDLILTLEMRACLRLCGMPKTSPLYKDPEVTSNSLDISACSTVSN